MGCWYSLQGTVQVRPCEEVARIIRRFNEERTELEAGYETGEGVATTVTFSGGENMNYGMPDEIDAIARELGTYTIEPTFLVWDFDGNERGRLYIGLEEEAETRSKATLAGFEQLLGKVTHDDEAALLAILSRRQKPGKES